PLPSGAPLAPTPPKAPWGGAGTIQSRTVGTGGNNFMRSRPAWAKIAPCQGFSINLSSRLFTLPLKSTTWWWGYRLSHWTFLLRLPVAMVAGRSEFKKFELLCTNTSLKLARRSEEHTSEL